MPVHGLWVHPDYRKQGIATRLKRLGEEWAEKMGALSWIARDANLVF
jgi:GNAT superfamily N-acetyltransferase